MNTCNIKFPGNGTFDTPLKHSRTFFIVRLFYFPHTHTNSQSGVEKLQTCFSGVFDHVNENTVPQKYGVLCQHEKPQAVNLYSVQWLGCGLGKRCTWFASRQGKKCFILSKASKTVLGPTQPPTQWTSGSLSQGVYAWDVKLTIYLHLIPRLGMSGVIPSLPNITPQRVHRKLCPSIADVTICAYYN